MNSTIQNDIRTGPNLRGNIRYYKAPTGTDLLARTSGLVDWQQARKQAGYWSISRSLKAAHQRLP